MHLSPPLSEAHAQRSLKQTRQRTHAGASIFRVLLEGHIQRRRRHYCLAQVDQATVRAIGHRDFQHGTPGSPQLQQRKAYDRVVIVLALLILPLLSLPHQIEDQLTQQAPDFDDLHGAFQRRGNRRAQVDVAHFQVRYHPNPMHHARR